MYEGCQKVLLPSVIFIIDLPVKLPVPFRDLPEHGAFDTQLRTPVFESSYGGWTIGHRVQLQTSYGAWLRQSWAPA